MSSSNNITHGRPWDEHANEGLPSIADQTEGQKEYIASFQAREKESAKESILHDMPRKTARVFYAVAKSHIQLGVLELILTFETKTGPAPKRKGKELPKGLLMKQERIAEELFTSQPTVNKAIAALSKRELILKVEGVYVLNWAEIQFQAMQAGWKPGPQDS